MSCSSVRAPTMIDVTPGLALTQFRATWATETPRPSAISASTSTTAKPYSSSIPPGVPSAARRVSSGSDCPRRNLPERKPPASGLHTRMPTPWSSERGTSSCSSSRETSE